MLLGVHVRACTLSVCLYMYLHVHVECSICAQLILCAFWTLLFVVVGAHFILDLCTCIYMYMPD